MPPGLRPPRHNYYKFCLTRWPGDSRRRISLLLSPRYYKSLIAQRKKLCGTELQHRRVCHGSRASVVSLFLHILQNSSREKRLISEIIEQYRIFDKFSLFPLSELLFVCVPFFYFSCVCCFTLFVLCCVTDCSDSFVR